MHLNTLSPAPGSTKAAKRVGRGIGSGSGKTSGSGHKGQKSRSGGTVRPGFEGGQMPLYQRLPKRGFNKPNRKSYAVINLGLIQKFVDAGKIDPKAAITHDVLIASGAVRRVLDGIRVLAKGEVTSKLNIEVHGASKSAVEAVEKAGGKLTLTAKVAPAAAE